MGIVTGLSTEVLVDLGGQPESTHDLMVAGTLREALNLVLGHRNN